MPVLSFQGYIENVSYFPNLQPELGKYDLTTFDINSAAASGIIDAGNNNLFGYSKWVSPKRTRSYPFARIYNTYYLLKKVTIIPIIKDEGIAGDNDRINFITLSWMNLVNVYVVLAWYDTAVSHRSREGKITGQVMNVDYVQERLWEITHYQQSALHWNKMHFTRDFEQVMNRAVESYEQVATSLSVEMHSIDAHRNFLSELKVDDVFSLDRFREITLPRSYQAAQREILTAHSLEYLDDGYKGYFSIENQLGGEYHLTADEIYSQDQTIIIQESKNSSKDSLPKIADIKDGLFKLILFSNMSSLFIAEKPVEFVVRLKLTGALSSSISLPTDELNINQYATSHNLSSANKQLLIKLNQEASKNPKLNILIGPNR